MCVHLSGLLLYQPTPVCVGGYVHCIMRLLTCLCGGMCVCIVCFRGGAGWSPGGWLSFFLFFLDTFLSIHFMVPKQLNVRQRKAAVLYVHISTIDKLTI